MKTNKSLMPELTSAMDEFVQQLPDPGKSFSSTIEELIVLDDKKIKLMAQKIKGSNGLCWNIDYKSVRPD